MCAIFFNMVVNVLFSVFIINGKFYEIKFSLDGQLKEKQPIQKVCSSWHQWHTSTNENGDSFLNSLYISLFYCFQLFSSNLSLFCMCAERNGKWRKPRGHWHYFRRWNQQRNHSHVRQSIILSTLTRFFFHSRNMAEKTKYFISFFLNHFHCIGTGNAKK